jgi:hypothetical protein
MIVRIYIHTAAYTYLFIHSHQYAFIYMHLYMHGVVEREEVGEGGSRVECHRRYG